MLGELNDIVLSLAAAVPRIAAAFLVLPLLTQESIPALARNSFFVALSLVVLPFAEAMAPPPTLDAVDWPMLILKEVFVGICLGFAFSAIFWAVSAAGNLIDAAIGTNMASISDPLAGHQDSLHGALMARFASWLFLASGAFGVFLDLLFGSYAIWPVSASFPRLELIGANLFVDRFAWVMTMSLLVAAPALVLLALTDFALGLINRYAPQLNMFALNMPIKSWLASFMVLLGVGVLVELVVNVLAESVGLLRQLRGVL